MPYFIIPLALISPWKESLSETATADCSQIFHQFFAVQKSNLQYWSYSLLYLLCFWWFCLAEITFIKKKYIIIYLSECEAGNHGNGNLLHIVIPDPLQMSNFFSSLSSTEMNQQHWHMVSISIWLIWFCSTPASGQLPLILVDISHNLMLLLTYCMDKESKK